MEQCVSRGQPLRIESQGCFSPYAVSLWVLMIQELLPSSLLSPDMNIMIRKVALTCVPSFLYNAQHMQTPLLVFLQFRQTMKKLPASHSPGAC